MKNKQSAFTLVEAMVAVTILSLIVAMVYGTFFSVMRVTQTGAKATQQIQRERIALKTIEAALSGIVYYEQNQQHYAFTADTADFNYPAISFVSRVPPDFLGGQEFGAQTLRRIMFRVEDDETHGKSLVMYQTTVLQPDENIGLGAPETGTRNVLGPGLDTFFVVFWSTQEGVDGWISEWTETNSVPARLKFEMAFKRSDGSSVKIADIHKREIMIYSGSITKDQQNPALPSSRGGGRGNSGRGGGQSRFTPEQIAEWRKRQSQSSGRSSGRSSSSSGRSSSRSMYSDAQRAAFRKRMAELAKRRGQQSGGGGRSSYSGGGSSNSNSGGSSNSNSGGGSTPGPGGGGGIPGQNVVNDALQFYFENTGQAATSISDLTNAGIVLPDPPAGTQWAIDQNTGTAIIRPL